MEQDCDTSSLLGNPENSRGNCMDTSILEYLFRIFMDLLTTLKVYSIEMWKSQSKSSTSIYYGSEMSTVLRLLIQKHSLIMVIP